jgi:hypothetical protein
MSRLAALPLLFGTALLLTSCSSNHAGPTDPTALVTGSPASSVVVSAALAPMPTAAFRGCPAATPFLAPFLLTVAPTGTVVVVTTITTRFTDSTGVPAQQVTLPAPVPTVQYGTALDQARNALMFPLDVCATNRRGTVTFTVITHDMFGRNGSGTVTVPVQ